MTDSVESYYVKLENLKPDSNLDFQTQVLYWKLYPFINIVFSNWTIKWLYLRRLKIVNWTKVFVNENQT